MATVEEWKKMALNAPHDGVRKDCLHAAEVIEGGQAPCGRCNGTGNELYSMYRKCPACEGDGVSKGNEDRFKD